MSQVKFLPIGLLLALPVAAGTTDPAALCLAAARHASAETGVPEAVLLALTLTETGRAGKNGAMSPWAWALNRGGKSLWFDTADDAIDYLATALAEGATNIDLGCFQLNWRWHAAGFASAQEMIDPAANALYAARLVARHFDDTGDWTSAAAAYHSTTPEYAERYLSRFTPIYAAVLGLDPGADDPPRAADKAARENSFPLLQAGGGAAAGSLVPLSGAARPLFGGS